MTQFDLTQIKPGMKVFAGSDEIGKVAAVRPHDLEVTRGLVFRHTYAIPARYVAEVSEEIVDLSVDKEAVHDMEVDDVPSRPETDAYRRIEFPEDRHDPTDSSTGFRF